MNHLPTHILEEDIRNVDPQYQDLMEAHEDNRTHLVWWFEDATGWEPNPENMESEDCLLAWKAMIYISKGFFLGEPHLDSDHPHYQAVITWIRSLKPPAPPPQPEPLPKVPEPLPEPLPPPACPLRPYQMAAKLGIKPMKGWIYAQLCLEKAPIKCSTAIRILAQKHEGACIPWSKSRIHNGTPCFRLDRTHAFFRSKSNPRNPGWRDSHPRVLPHRLLWKTFRGPVPPLLSSTCKCINPWHWRPRPPCGGCPPSLSKHQIQAIKCSTMTNKELARKYNVSERTISRAKKK